MRQARGSSLLRNSVYIMSSTVVGSLLGYVYWIVAARTYSAHDVGLAAALIAAMTLASTVATVGVGSTLVQILPRQPHGTPWALALNAAVATALAAAAVAAVVAVVALPLFSADLAVVRESPAYAAAFAAGVLLSTASMLLDYTFVAERAAGNMLARNLLFSAAKIPVLVAPFLVAAHALGILASWVVAGTFAAAAGVVLVLRLPGRYRRALRGLAAQLRGMAAALVGHHFTNLGGVLPMYVLPVFVAVRLSPTDNAYFYATWMAGGLFFMVSAAVASALFAEGSHATEDIGRKVRSSAAIIGALTAPAALVFLFAGGDIMALFGAGYAEHASPLLVLLVASAAPEAAVNVYVTVLRVEQRLRFAALFTLSLAAIALTLAWILLPSLGIAGAGWAWLTAQLLGSGVVAGDALARRVAPGRRGRRARGRDVVPLGETVSQARPSP